MVTNEETSALNYSLNSKINQKAREIIKNNGIKVQGSAKITSQRNMMKLMNKVNAKNAGPNLPMIKRNNSSMRQASISALNLQSSSYVNSQQPYLNDNISKMSPH